MLGRTLLNTTRKSVIIRFNSTATNEAYNVVLNGLKKDLKQALLSKNEVKKTTIRNMMASLKNKSIDSKTHTLDTFGIYATYEKMINQRKDSITEYLNNKREDLVEKEQKELDIIKEYQKLLPVISKEELKSNVKKLLESLKQEDSTIELKGIFSKVDWKSLPDEWKASKNMIKSSIVEQYNAHYATWKK
ncbi:hypothetical protein MOUN0_L03268 [Monosporozyma unispora]|nr:Altered inheritance of mitochondria protein 41 mitochondrial [Kazachstania unispora]